MLEKAISKLISSTTLFLFFILDPSDAVHLRKVANIQTSKVVSRVREKQMKLQFRKSHLDGEKLFLIITI